MQFLSDREIIKSIIQIDCEQFLQIIAGLFIDGKPYEFVVKGRIDKQKDEHS